MTSRKKPVPTKAVDAPTLKIYIGPGTKYLPRFTVYTNGLPAVATAHIEQCPALGALFIDPEKLTDAQLKLLDSASAEAVFYNKAKEYFEGVK